MRFSVVNLGCKVNRVESDEYVALLSEYGMQTEERLADLVVINTCTVTGEAEKKARKAVRRALRASDHSTVVVTGCAAALERELFESLSPRVNVIGKGEMRAYLSDLSSSAAKEERARPAPHLLRMGMGFNTRVGIKVQDGCDNACTFCIVHKARGKAQSRDIAECIDECASYAHAGVMEIVLTGINLGSYGSNGKDLTSLLTELLDETEGRKGAAGFPCRFRISSIEPMDLGEDLIELLASSEGRICRHLHLPLQSGSSKVLREMARPYDAEDYRSLVGRIRAAIPSISLSTDIIVGFPGETQDDFESTLELARECGFSKIHAFPYSKRKGTPAAERSDQIPDDVKASRAAELRDLAEALRYADYERRVGTTELVIAESDERGCTESYYEIPLDGSWAAGSLFEMTLPKAHSLE